MEGYGIPEGGGWVRREREFNFLLLYGLVVVALITVGLMFVEMFVIEVGPEGVSFSPFWFMVLVILVYSPVVVVYSIWQDRYWGTFWVTYSREWPVEPADALEAVRARMERRDVKYVEGGGAAGIPRTRGVRLKIEEFTKMEVEVHLTQRDRLHPGRGVVVQLISSRDDMELLDDVIMDIEAAMADAAEGDPRPDLVLHDR